jgi:hypothetical protein
MNDNELSRLLNEALHIPLPKGLSERLEGRIDQWASKEKKQNRRRLLYWATGAAAAIALAVGIFFPAAPQRQQADTYSDPHEAAIAAEQALAFMSAQLNKGLDQVSSAQEEIEKVNEILNKHFKE